MSAPALLPLLAVRLLAATPTQALDQALAPAPSPALANPWNLDFPDLLPWQWLGLAAVLVGSMALALGLERVLLGLGARLAKLTVFQWDDQLVAAGRGPLRLSLWGALMALGLLALRLPGSARHPFDLVVRSLIIVSVAWFIQRALGLVGTFLEQRVEGDTRNDPMARGRRTQVVALRHFFEVAVYVVGAALLLLQFDVVRNVGVSLLASAGLAGLVLGLAAQKSISTLLAGIQLSITQPIVIGDAVTVEAEFGTVEEITLTYVVVRLWDFRRLVLPISYFLEKPFQNWSKGVSELVGVVLLEVDFIADVNAFRAELARILEAPEARALWTGRLQKVVVTNATDRTKTLRVTVSADNVDTVFDLRCLIREQLVDFLARHPAWMPLVRNDTRESGLPAGEERKPGSA